MEVRCYRNDRLDDGARDRTHPSQWVSVMMTSESSYGNQLRRSSHSTDTHATHRLWRGVSSWWLRHHSLCVGRIDETASSVQDWSRGQKCQFSRQNGTLIWQSFRLIWICVFSLRHYMLTLCQTAWNTCLWQYRSELNHYIRIKHFR